MKYFFYNGKAIESCEHSLLCQALEMGQGIFTTLRFEEGAFFLLQEHLDSLSLQFLDCFSYVTKVSFQDLECIWANPLFQKGVWRVKLILIDGENHKKHLLVSVQGYQERALKRLTLGLGPYPQSSFFCRYKHVGYFENYYLHNQAQKKGLDDYLLCDPSGNLLEASMANIFWLSKGVCYTPSADLPLYFGTTIRYLKKALETQGTSFVEGRFLPSCLLKEVEGVFLCSSVRGIVGVDKLIFEGVGHNIPTSDALENRLKDIFFKFPRTKKAFSENTGEMPVVSDQL